MLFNGNSLPCVCTDLKGLQGLSAPSEDEDKCSGKQMQGREPGEKKQQLKHLKKRPGGDQSSREREGRAAGLCLLRFPCKSSFICIVNFTQPLGSLSSS